MAMDAVNIYSQEELRDGRPPWLQSQEAQWEHLRATTPHPTANGGGYTVSASPHQPAYYGLLALVYKTVSSDSPFAQLTALRLASTLFGVIVALCAFGVVREMLPKYPLAAASAGLLVAFHPMFSFIAGAVNNDNGVNAAAAVVLYLVIRGLRRQGLTVPLSLGLGLALALAPAMKESGYEIYPPAAVGVLGMVWRHHRLRDIRGLIGLAATLAAVKIGWSLSQSEFYPAIHGHSEASSGVAAVSALKLAEQMPGRFLTYLWELFLPKLSFMGSLFPPGWPFEHVYVIRGWAAFGWYVWTFPKWVYGAIILAMGLVGLLAVSTAAREWAATRKRLFELAVIALYPACVLVAVEAVFFTPDGGRTVFAEQGRYLFPAIAALAAIAVSGTFGLGRRWHAPIATVLVVATIGLCYASQLLTLSSFFT